MRKRIGIFGWGVVAPKSPNVDAFRENLKKASSWLEPFSGFGPCNFLVGRPEFDFHDYKTWIDERFEPRKYSQLDTKMGNSVKYAIGAFIQALSQNSGMEAALKELGKQAHIYFGTGLGDFPIQYENVIHYYKAQKRWNRFWCQPERHSVLADYYGRDENGKAEVRAVMNAPQDPDALDLPEHEYEDAKEAWHAFWIHHSDGLKAYLARVREIESVDIGGEIETGKSHVIRHKAAARRKLNQEYGCPPEPWTSVNPKVLWNIPNIPAAQISMLGKITGTCVAPIAACSGFVTALKLADQAIQLGEAKIAVAGMTDPEPHPLSVGAFYGARVISHDGQASKPFTGLRGTHISGGACVWIVGDYDYCVGLGMKPLGLEIIGIGLSADAHHIITPNKEGPRAAIESALEEAGVEAGDIDTWDMHATATPGDWTELTNAMALFPESTVFTARKGSFGHGMSVCGGWELTAQHMGVNMGRLHPVNVVAEEFHELIKPYAGHLVQDSEVVMEDGKIAGKINMGIGGVNACIICRQWED